jgi:hypothetical protein
MSAERGKPPSFPLWPSNLETRVDPEKTPNFVWEKKLRDLSPSKGFQFVSLSFPKVEKPRFLS